MTQGSGHENSNWRGSAARERSKRMRARRWFVMPETCEHEDCSSPPLDRHHVDGNVENNERENVRFLCRRHHMEEDGRLARFVAFTRTGEPGRLGGAARPRRLSEAQVIEIRATKGLVSGREWARRLGVSEPLISRIRSGAAYAHVGKDVA